MLNKKSPSNPFRAGRKTFIGGLLLILAIGFTTCGKISEQVFQDKISEGHIEYDITFPDIEQDQITASLLPTKMYLFFNNKTSSLEFESMGGVFKNRIIAFGEQKKVAHELKVFRKKLSTLMTQSQVADMISDFPDCTIILTNETDSVAGFLCRKATVVFSDVERPEYNVYFTEAINLITPNWYNQYARIPGVLMAYEIEQFGIKMRLEATQVHAEPVPPEFFTATEGYEEVSQEIMQVEMEQLVSTFEY